MPIVVVAKTKADFAKWLADQQARRLHPRQPRSAGPGPSGVLGRGTGGQPGDDGTRRRQTGLTISPVHAFTFQLHSIYSG